MSDSHTPTPSAPPAALIRDDSILSDATSDRDPFNIFGSPSPERSKEYHPPPSSVENGEILRPSGSENTRQFYAIAETVQPESKRATIKFSDINDSRSNDHPSISETSNTLRNSKRASSKTALPPASPSSQKPTASTPICTSCIIS